MLHEALRFEIIYILKVFCRGLTVIQNEEHLHFLDMKHKQFQARVMKRMLESQDSDGDTGNATQQVCHLPYKQ